MKQHEGEPRKRIKLSRGQWILGLAILAVVGLGAGALVQYLQSDTKPQPAVDQKITFPPSVTSAQSLLQAGKPDEARQAVQAALDNPAVSAEEKRLLYVEQGRIATAQQNYREAAEALTKAWEIKQTYDVANKLGATWQQVGDNAKALAYYKQALQLNSQDSPTYEAENNILRQMIDILESEQ